MPPFTLRWANRSQSTQDWSIQNFDSFTLQPDFVRPATANLNSQTTFNVAVNADTTFAAASLVYSPVPNTWTLQSHTPNEWQLQTGNGIVTLRCLLEAHAATHLNRELDYTPSEPELAGGVRDTTG